MPGYCWFPLTGLYAPHHPSCSPLMLFRSFHSHRSGHLHHPHSPNSALTSVGSA